MDRNEGHSPAVHRRWQRPLPPAAPAPAGSPTRQLGCCALPRRAVCSGPPAQTPRTPHRQKAGLGAMGRAGGSRCFWKGRRSVRNQCCSFVSQQKVVFHL